VARTQIGWRPIYVIGSRRAQVQALLFNMRGGHNGFAIEAGFFKDPMCVVRSVTTLDPARQGAPT